MASKREKKAVRIIGRCEFKADTRKVVYLVRPSSGEGQYQTFMFDGKALSCTCPARKPCYHMDQLELIEAARAERKAQQQDKKTVEQVVLLLPAKAASLEAKRGREFQIAMERQLRAIEAARPVRQWYEVVYGPTSCTKIERCIARSERDARDNFRGGRNGRKKVHIVRPTNKIVIDEWESEAERNSAPTHSNLGFSLMR